MMILTRLDPMVRHAWGPDTCDPHDLPDWRADNPARGQCGPTALVVNDLLGGDLVMGEVHEDGARVGVHYWNRLPGGTEVDLTRDQFRPAETVTPGSVVVRPGGPPRRCRGQYELLRHRVLAASGGLGRVAAPGGPAIDIDLVLLVDPAGSVLLQLRDPDARAEPGQWSLPGGHREPGEKGEAAARRELAEETGLLVDGPLALFWQGSKPDLTGAAEVVRVSVHAARCGPIGPDDIMVREGQAARFVAVSELRELDLSPTAAAVFATSGLLSGHSGAVAMQAVATRPKPTLA